jgi:hypothetical protein
MSELTPLARRAALRLFAGAPVLAILPVAGAAPPLVSTTSPVHPDAALFALQSAIDAADGELDVALEALEAADKAYHDKQPDKPSPPPLSTEEEQAMVEFAARTAEVRFSPSPASAAYEQAARDHEREVERLKAECGVTAAHEMESVAHEAMSHVHADLIDTPAETLAGLIFKARYAEANDCDEEVMQPIVEDLLAMAEELANV